MAKTFRDRTHAEAGDLPARLTLDVAKLERVFAPLLAGRHTGQPGLLWRCLDNLWIVDLTDEDYDILLMRTAVETAVEGKAWDIERSCLRYCIADAIEQRDYTAMLVLADAAEDAGVSPLICDLTRRSIRVQYEK